MTDTHSKVPIKISGEGVASIKVSDLVKTDKFKRQLAALKEIRKDMSLMNHMDTEQQLEEARREIDRLKQIETYFYDLKKRYDIINPAMWEFYQIIKGNSDLDVDDVMEHVVNQMKEIREGV